VSVVPQEQVAAVRAFNRFYTNLIGALRDDLLGTSFSLTEARVLFELAQAGEVEMSDLRQRLDLDAGYLSRILTRFEKDGLVRRNRSAFDGRRQVITLTPDGREAFTTLDARANEQIVELLAPLGPEGQAHLVAAINTMKALLTTARRSTSYSLREPKPGEMGWIVQRHGALYAAEYELDASFEALVARTVGEYATTHDTRYERVWIADIDGEPVGCIGCVREDDTTARLRWLLVEPWARGMGIGARLVTECVTFARQAGYHRIVLWTIDVLETARRLYQRAGFRLAYEERRPLFGRHLVDQDWVLELR